MKNANTLFEQLYRELILLNISLFTLDRIIEANRNKNVKSLRAFLIALITNYINYSIVTIRKIYYDNASDAMTLKRLKNLIKNLNSRKIKESIRIEEITRGLNDFETVINSLRNTQLAHLTKINEDVLVTFQELQKIATL